MRITVQQTVPFLSKLEILYSKHSYNIKFNSKQVSYVDKIIAISLSSKIKLEFLHIESIFL